MSIQSSEDYARAYAVENADFARKATELGFEEAASFHWYHTIDVGNGLVTPGIYDYRNTIEQLQFPSVAGKTVLDVGPATGYFSFHFEQRGASRVVGSELPSLLNLDRFPGQSVFHSLDKIYRMLYPHREAAGNHVLLASEPDLYHKLLDGPYRFCHSLLKSRAERYFFPIYDLSLEKLDAAEPFDLVFAGDVLLHLLEPVRALGVLASLCKGTLILSQIMPASADGQPAVRYVGGSSLDDDDVSWWHPNAECFTQVLKKLGFPSVRVVGTHSGVLKSSGFRFERTIIQANRGVPA